MFNYNNILNLSNTIVLIIELIMGTTENNCIQTGSDILRKAIQLKNLFM